MTTIASKNWEPSKMENNQDKIIRERVEKIEKLVERLDSHEEAYEAAMLAQAVLNDTVGGAHPLMASIKNALEKPSITQAHAAGKALVKLFKEGGLVSPRLLIAHEIESSFLDLAQSQAESAEKATDNSQKQIYRAIASFLCGATLEDALRRLCDNRGIQYDTQHTSISKLQSNLYQPSNQTEIISQSENKQITTWADTRNKADHGKFSEITQTEVLTMVIGVRAFIDKHLP